MVSCRRTSGFLARRWIMGRGTVIASSAVGAVMLVVAGCSQPPGPPAPRAAADPIPSTTVAAAASPKTPEGAQPRLAADPAQLADDLVADEHALRDPSTGEPG